MHKTAVFAAAAALAWTAAAQAAGPAVDVQLRLLSPDALEVSYALPPSCQSLAFVKDGGAGRASRANWQAVEGGGQAGADRLQRGSDGAGSAVLRFRVPAATRHAGYPAAFSVGQGLYAHLSNYAVDESCGKPVYRLAAAGIAANGRAYRGSAVAEGGAGAAVLLLSVPLAAKGRAVPAYFDPRIPAATVARIGQLADGTVAYLTREMPHAVYTRPMLAAGFAQEPGGPQVSGDAADVLRLSLINWPLEPGPAEQLELTKLVTHEFSHRFQMRDAVDVYPDERLIHEGGGEFLRWMTSVHNGWLTPAQAASQLDNALSDCMLYTEGRSWRALTPREIAVDRLAYHCGLPAYVYALAARQGKGRAIRRVDGFYQGLRAGGKPDFAQALECGAATSCRARYLPHLLGADGPMDAQWSRLFEATVLATPAAPTLAQKNAMVLRAMVKLMKDDCGGHSGTTETPDGVIMDGMKVCKTFRQDAYVTTIEGLPVFGDPATGEAMTAACGARHALVLGLKEGGTLNLPCLEPYRMRSAFYHADIERLLAALRRE